jgi:transposase
VRVICFVEGEGSLRDAAEQFDIGVSSAIRWVRQFHEIAAVTTNMVRLKG